MQKLDAGHETDVITPPFGSTGVGAPHEDEARAVAVGIVVTAVPAVDAGIVAPAVADGIFGGSGMYVRIVRVK
ncbi:MAG: hypothetical protein M1399_05870 [Actinobacteria bacterium]|nr:hypothetical protein [Actinomycetota bacterium]